MKQNLSIPSLAIRLTAVPALLVTAAVCIVQRLMSHPAYSPDESLRVAFDQAMPELYGLAGWLGLIALAAVLVLCMTPAKSDFSITLRRLSVPRGRIAVWTGLLFAAYFFLYWAVQTALILWLYAIYARGAGLPAIELAVNSYRLAYMHLLIPLADVWGYGRNLAMALSFGMLCSCIPLSRTRGGRGLLSGLTLGWIGVCFAATARQPARQSTDIALTLFGLLIFAVAAFAAWKEGAYAED